jgi:uncharacterized Zn finger protein
MKRSPPITVTALRLMRGEVDGRTAGSEGRHRVIVHVAPLESGAWEGVVTALVVDPALVAAILDGELPAALVAAAGPRALEPSPGELWSECGCRRRQGRCAHVRAVWREVQDALRREPALLLTLRGRDALSLAADASGLAALSTRDQDLGVDATAAYERTAGGLPPLPDIPAPVAASRPDSWLEPDILSQRLLDQAADAASRALDILRETGDGCLELDRKTDVARIGAAFASPWDVSHLAWRAGMSPVELGRLIRAWEAGGRGDRAPVAPTRQPHVVTAVTSETGPALEQLSLFDAHVRD